jgi:hypothetical protein
MIFGQRYSIRKNLKPVEMVRYICNPQMRLWRDVIEDYLYISKKRYKNKLSMFKLQLNILQEIIINIKIIDGYKELEKKLIVDEKKGDFSRESFEQDKKHIKSEIYGTNILNKALREIADGIVWKYFNYNRAILCMLADKQPIEIIRPDEGTFNNLYEFSDVFLDHDSVAIYNDITNFLRVGDVTQIKEDGSIEIIEVKTRKKRGGRITRQKERMSELVEFFNSGLTKYDGKILKIENSNIKQKTYLNLLRNAIQKARHRGFESLLIGKYLILEIADLSKFNDLTDFISYFESRHKTIQEEWSKKKDLIHSSFFIDKMDYSKNCAPFSIYPFGIETCTDIMMGRLMIKVLFNFSEILRILRKSGWNIEDALDFKSEDEIKAHYGKDVKDISFLKVRKGPLSIDVPPSLIARMKYELLSPSSVIERFEEIYKRGPQKDFDYCLTNYTEEQKIWN